MVLGALLASCERVSQSEWENFFGYTNEDVIGTYSFSNVADAFEGVEGVGRHASPDAEISIEPYSANTIEFKINCPSQGFNRSFTGKPMHIADDVMLRLSSGYKPYNGGLRAYNVTGYVLKNTKSEVRLHGYAAVNTYRIEQMQTPQGLLPDTIQVDGTYYYFDVIKN